MIVVSSQSPLNKEAATINAMFDNGLKLLHIRKPDATVKELRHLIAGIDLQNYHQLALNQHHEIASDYGIKRLHFKEVERLKQSERQLNSLKQNGYMLSTSVHSWESYEALTPMFSYAFIGPVFNSISKEGYNAMKHIESGGNSTVKRIAIGGISKENLDSKILKAFDGVAVLGSIWLSGEPLKEFKLLQQKWTTAGRQF
ncbi:thiamine phosphate synthase [Flavobacterium sp. RHBU_24]|uniref:thiamine phosphate synthase n=1 Tax=Flavobacterium sp. RHBU_24 TaxID=3391185 RepID=UPI0039849E90